MEKNCCDKGCGTSRESVAVHLEGLIERKEKELTQLRELHSLAVNLTAGSPLEEALNTLVWNQRVQGLY